MKVWTHETGWIFKEKDDSNNGIEIQKHGVFKKNGEIFIVKPNKDKTRMYALRLVEAPSDRITIAGEIVPFDFEYAKGAIYNLTEADRMNIEEAKKLMIRYGRCIVCRRKLKVAKSVEEGIGPVCKKYFRGVD